MARDKIGPDGLNGFVGYGTTVYGFGVCLQVDSYCVLGYTSRGLLWVKLLLLLLLFAARRSSFQACIEAVGFGWLLDVEF